MLGSFEHPSHVQPAVRRQPRSQVVDLLLIARRQSTVTAPGAAVAGQWNTPGRDNGCCWRHHEVY